VILSVLICSLHRRADQLQKLVESLSRQMEEFGLTGNVEILTCVDQGVRDGGMSIGEKRNTLMESASGDYVCFVDDDDSVSPKYLPLLVAACEEGPDCVGITGEIYWMGEMKPFEHSMVHKTFINKPGVFLRPPNHINPVKREIAKKFPFPSKSFGEDVCYALDMAKAGVLKTEVVVPESIYTYIPGGEVRHGD